MNKHRYQHRNGSMQLVIFAIDFSYAEDKLKKTFPSTWGDWIYLNECRHEEKLGL